ncbi:MAG: MFS transporter [Candidatus Rokubacteria bacterium]|nr:MFS transporter [Candidatus Rokubacteria bacterium]
MSLLLWLTAAILSLCTGLRQSLGLFLPPMTLELGISATAFSFAVALQAIVWGVSQPLVGMLADRVGTRPVLVGASLVYASGLVLMGHPGGALGLDLGGVLVGLGTAGTGLGVVLGAVSRAVAPERRSQTVGAVAAAGSIGTFLLAPIGQWLIDGVGWRTALLALAAIAASMALLALPVRDVSTNAGTSGAAAEDTRSLREVLRAAARHPGYLAMTAAFFACGFQLMFITMHLPAYLASCGLPPGVGATAMAIIGLCNTVGTYTVGLLGARYRQKRLLALIYLLRTLSIVVFLAVPITRTSTLVFAAAMGLLWLGVAPLVSGLVGRVFGLKYFGTLYGFVFLSHQLGSMAGVLLGGIAFDLTQSYGAAWGALIAIGLLAFMLQWPMNDHPLVARPRRAAAPSHATLLVADRSSE